MQEITKSQKSDLLSFLDIATTATGRATHYNSADEQSRLEVAAHLKVYQYQRDLYWRVGLLPGVLDRAKMRICRYLLAQPDILAQTTRERETAAIEYMVHSLPPQRFFEFGATCAENKISNSRTKRILREYLRRHTSKLDLWAVRYHGEFFITVQHILGKNVVDGMRRILREGLQDTPRFENGKCVYPGDFSRFSETVKKLFGEYFSLTTAVHILAFVLDENVPPSIVHPLPDSSPISKWFAAHNDIEAGKGLPEEVLQGIRATFHPTVPAAEAKALGTNTAKQKVMRQAEYAAAGVELKLTRDDLLRQPLADLLKLLYQDVAVTRPLADSQPVALPYAEHADAIRQREIFRAAVYERAQMEAEQFGFLREGDVVVVDVSKSMDGSDQRKWQPICFAHAFALCAMQHDVPVLPTTFLVQPLKNNLHESAPLQKLPRDDMSNLAYPVAVALDKYPGTVYLVTDGYENAPAGRLHELLKLVPDRVVVQVSPVAAAESGGVKRVSDRAPLIAASSIAQLQIGMIRAQLETAPALGVQALIDYTDNMLEDKHA